MTKLVEFNRVSKRYLSGQEALSNVSFTLNKGEMVFLTGHSGAGKSTLLKLIAALEKPSGGEALFENINLNRITPRRIPFVRRKIGLIFQNPFLLSDRTVIENVILPLVITGCDYQETGKRARAILDKVGLLHKEKALPESLSAGEQQRVSIARALISRPPLVLADEPTGNLDPELSGEIMHLFEQFNQIGVTLLIATHDIALINQLQHRRLTLKEGVLTHDEEGLTV